MQKKFVVFVIDNEYFGLPIEEVERILPDQPITRIPRTPKMLLGVFDLRGDTIAAVDLRLRFERVPSTEDGNLIVVLNQFGRVALRVDRLDGIVAIHDEDVSTETAFFANAEDDFVGGVARQGDRLILMLKPDEVIPAKLRPQLLKVAA